MGTTITKEYENSDAHTLGKSTLVKAIRQVDYDGESGRVELYIEAKDSHDAIDIALNSGLLGEPFSYGAGQPFVGEAGALKVDSVWIGMNPIDEEYEGLWRVSQRFGWDV